MARSTLTAPIPRENIKVAYKDITGVLVEDVSISDANLYEESNPGTTYIFLDGDNKYRYLNIDEVNDLVVRDLITTKTICDTSPKPCGSPHLVFTGGDGVGVEANPIISPGGVLLGIDVVNPGSGYQTPPTVKVVDECDIGSGAIVQTTIENGEVTGGVVLDSGSNYIPAQPSAFSGYPAILSLQDVIVNNPGINYNPGVDVIEITPNNGAVLQAIYNPFGQVTDVKVVRPGIGYVSRPTITIRSESGVNADFTPVFEIIRDPVLFSPQLQQRKIITVIDTVGLRIQGYVGGKPYYGNVYFDAGVKYAGPYKTFESPIRVYDTLAQSIK